MSSVPENAAAAGTGDGPGVVVPMPGTTTGASATPRPTTAPTSLQVLRALDSGPRGLVEAEAEERLARFGENILPAWRPVPWPLRFLRTLRDPFTSVLFCLGLVSAAVNAWGTASVTLVLVLVSCLLRSAEEHRADRATAALRELVATTATVLRRSGPQAAPQARDVPVGELVPGDVIRLGPGDLVPADVQLLRASGLTVHQSALTGESAPVGKRPADDVQRQQAPPTLHSVPEGAGVCSPSASCVSRAAVWRPGVARRWWSRPVGTPGSLPRTTARHTSAAPARSTGRCRGSPGP